MCPPRCSAARGLASVASGISSDDSVIANSVKATDLARTAASPTSSTSAIMSCIASIAMIGGVPLSMARMPSAAS